MAVLQKGKSIYPFWGESISLITGLDPLSLQTTSEATYSSLLPGISNLTNRLRYYGFYCWLLDFYFQREDKGNAAEQYRFIRRAELMIAILMQSERKEVLQITGSSFASNMIGNRSEEFFDLAKGADKEGDKAVYWKYPSGAFGQYYFGAMRALALVAVAINPEGKEIYKLSQLHPRQKVSGKQLAEAFDQTLTAEIKDLFYQNIKTGRLQDPDIPVLIQYFAIDKIDFSSPEWPLYVSMLMDKDDPSQELEEKNTFHRRVTILELLKTAKSNSDKLDWHLFLLQAYEKKLVQSELQSSTTLVGWYAYKFNEYYQYACGAIFWAVLQRLYLNQKEEYLPEFVTALTKSVTEELVKSVENTNPEITLKEFLSLIPEELREEDLYKSIETKGYSIPEEAAKNGFLLLFRLYLENRDSLHGLKEFMNRREMIREGNMIDGLFYLHSVEGESLENFVYQFILRKTIYRHQMVALRKMGNGSQATHKFILEDQFIRFIDTFPPRATSPRMVALGNLLSDLQVIGSDGMLTPKHEIILSK